MEKHPELQILAESNDAGVYIVSTINRHHLFISGGSEYDPLTLKAENDHDVNMGLPSNVPKNYYPNHEPTVCWRGHASLLYSNWLNYYQYFTKAQNRVDV